MKYILDPESGDITFSKYLNYLESVREQMPPRVYAIASNEGYYDLSSVSSLHDAWMESLTIREVATQARRRGRRLEIDLSLLGAYHDRWIRLTYKNVRQYCLDKSTGEGEGHGDVLIHEFRLSKEGFLVHEISFEGGTTLTIECEDILHSEEICIP